MYGQTNCFVLPEGNYGTFETVNGDVLVVSHRSARGMAYQGITKEWGRAESIVDLKGFFFLFSRVALSVVPVCLFVNLIDRLFVSFFVSSFGLGIFGLVLR
jgi:hypothetical protein